MKSLFEQRWKLALFRWVAPLIAKVASPCTEIARLASEACDRKLTWRERWRVRMHYLICDWCRRYTEQLRLLHRLTPQLAEKAPQFRQRPMPAEARQRLKRRLQADGRA
jgi:hypothetical protein